MRRTRAELEPNKGIRAPPQKVSALHHVFARSKIMLYRHFDRGLKVQSSQVEILALASAIISWPIIASYYGSV